MKVLLINGSPHEKGCTYTILGEVAGELEKAGVQTEIFHVGTGPIRGCNACPECQGSITGRCAFGDDSVNAALEKAEKADGFVFGSPVHFAGASGMMTSFMDRFFEIGSESGKKFAFKPAAAVVCCRRGGATATFDQLNKYFIYSGMPVVPSQYWNMVHGNTPEEVRQDLEGMQTMRTLAKNMAWLLRCIEAGRQSGAPPPEHEEEITTNFIR